VRLVTNAFTRTNPYLNSYDGRLWTNWLMSEMISSSSDRKHLLELQLHYGLRSFGIGQCTARLRSG
jgi:hypothetical protein